MHQERQNMQTTSKKKLEAIKNRFDQLKSKKQPGQTFTDILQAELDEDSFPVSPSPNVKPIMWLSW